MFNEIILGVLLIVTLVLVVMLFRFFQMGGIKTTEKEKTDTPSQVEEIDDPPA